MAEKDFEADDLELKDYAFEPKTYTVNDVQITDYTGIEHDKIFLVNKKDILTKPRPSWIPELDENCLEREDFLPHCVKDSDGYYFVQKTSLEVPEDYNGPKLSDYEKRQRFTKKTYYKMSLDLIAATCDYYIKKRRAEIKLSGDTHRVGFPRSAGSMTWARYDDMVSMFSLCEAYKDDPEITKNYGHVKARRSNPKHKGYIRQTEIAFHDHYGPLLQELKDKKLDMNLQKQDAADTHKKGEETSYGMSGRSDTLKKNFGVTIKKQNGTGFDSQQLKNISEALENVWNHYGKLDDVAIAFNLGISYAANTLQHARKAVGIFHPEYHAIGVSFFEEKVADSKDSSMVLCHEVAHWLDFEKGNRDHFHYASDKSGTLENKIALKFKELVRKRNSGGKKLGDYWYRTCECLARAMEEDYGLKHDCYDFYNDQAYLTPEVFKKEIAPLVEQLLEENRKYFNLVKKENLSQELSTAKDLSFFDINENTLRKLIKSYTSSAASLAETEKTKPDTFNYLRGANKAMDNKINRYQEKIVKLQTKVDVLNMLVQLETKQAFGQFEMKTLEADICPVDRDDILRMDKNTFEYYAAVINSALKNAGFSEKKSIPLVLKNPGGYTFNTLNILEDGNIEVVSGSVNSLSEDEFKSIEEKNLELQKKIFDEVKIQLEKKEEKNIENNSLQQPEHKNILPSLSSDDSFVSDFRSGKFNSIFDRLSDLNFKDDFISSGSLYSKSRIEGINNLWLELFKDGVPPAVIKFENEWEKKIEDGNFNAPSFKEKWIEEASKAENEKLLSYFSKMSVPDENLISEHNGHLFRTMIINAIAKQSRLLTNYTDPFSNIVLYQKPECLLEKKLRYEIVENEIKKRGLKIMQDKEIENNKETSEKTDPETDENEKSIQEEINKFKEILEDEKPSLDRLKIMKTRQEVRIMGETEDNEGSRGRKKIAEEKLKIINDHVKQIENPLFYQNEKTEPVQLDLFEVSENNKEYWITDKDGNRITNSDAKKIIKDNLDLLNRLSEEKTPAANSKMVTASYISDYLLERLNKEDAQEVKNFTESFYDNIRNDYLSSLSDERIAILLGKDSGTGFSFNESEANFFRKNLEKKLIRNDYFIGTLQTVVNDFSKEWSNTLEKENPQLISLLKKACDESVDYELRLYTAYLSYHYKHDPDDVAGYSLETFKDKIENDKTLMEKYLSAYPEFEKLHNEYIEHNKISKKENLVSIFSNKDLSNRVSKGKKLIDEYLEKYFEAKNVSHNLIDLYAVGDAKRYVSVNYNGSFYKNLSKEQKKQASEFNEKLEQVLKEYVSKRLAEKKDEPEEAKAVSDLYKWARKNHPFANFTDSVIEEICFGMWEAEDKILLKEHEEQFPDIKYLEYPGTEWVLNVIEKHRDEYKDADFTVLSDTLVKEIEAEKINNQKKIEFLKKELDNKEYPLSKTEASDINENIRRFESLTDEDFKNLVLWKQRMLKESEARRNAVFEDMLEKEKRKSTVQEGEMYSYNDLHPSVTVINRKTNRQAEIRPTGTSAKNLMQLCGLKSLSEADNLIQKIQAAGFSILSTDARIILYNDEKYYDFRENHASYSFATREFEYDEDKRNLKIWDFRDYIKKGLKITKKMKEFEKIENLGETKMEHKYTFFVKDTAEFEQFADFEPVTNLSAEEAFNKLLEYEDKGYSAGIGIHIPDDYIFDDPDGEGSIIFEKFKDEYSFYIGDNFVKELKIDENHPEHASNVINAYKALDSVVTNYRTTEEGKNLPYKEPLFLYEKEKELFGTKNIEKQNVISPENIKLNNISKDVLDINLSQEPELVEHLVKNNILASETNWTADKEKLEELKKTDRSNRPGSSIWGKVDSCHKMIPGVYTVDTSGHGGIMVHESVASKILSKEALDCAELENGFYQYEEDVDAHIPLIELYKSHLCEGFSWNKDNQGKFFVLGQQSLAKYRPEYLAGFIIGHMAKNEIENARNLINEQKLSEKPELNSSENVSEEESRKIKFFIYAVNEEKAAELKEHLKNNSYNVSWEEHRDDTMYYHFTAGYDAFEEIKTILEDRNIDYEYMLGLLSTGYDAVWLEQEEQMDAEIVTEDEFKRINELREKEFKDLKLPYIKIDFTEGTTSSHKPAMMESGTVLGLKEGEELLSKLNRRFNTFLKCDVTVNFPDTQDNEPSSYQLRYDFEPDYRTLENGKKVPFERDSLSDYIRMTCSYPEVLEKFEEQWQKVNAPDITDEQKEFISDIISSVSGKLEKSYKKHLESLKALVENDKKHSNQWIISADVAKESKEALDKRQNEIAFSFKHFTGLCINYIADYLEKNKGMAFKDEFINYAHHQISNMLQDVKYGKSRNAKYGEHGYDFDFSLWRKSLEKVMDSSDFKTFFIDRLQEEQKRSSEVRAAAKDMGLISKNESLSLGTNVSVSLKQIYDYYANKGEVLLDNYGKTHFVKTVFGSIRHNLDEEYYDLYSKEGELLCCDGETVSFEGEAQSGNLIFKNNDVSFSLSKDEFELAIKTVSVEIELDSNDSYYELFRDNVTGKLITEELNQMGFVKAPDGNYVLDDIKVSLSLVFNNKENPALIISHISDPAVMQTIHLNDSYAKKHSLGMSFKDLFESGWLKETKNPNLKSFIDGKMLERDFIGKYIPDADNNKAVTLLDDITAYEEGFSDVLKSFKDFKDAWDIPVSSEQEVFEFGGKLQKALYNAAEAIKDKKAYADSLLRYAEKYKPGMEDPDNVYGKFKFHEDELKVFLKVNMINASIYNMATDINKNGTQIVFALMSSKDKRHYGYITADFDDPANCKYNFTDLKEHNLDISLTENISKMRDFCEKGKPFYEASENHSVNIELTSDGSKLSLTFNEVPDIDLRSSLNWAGFKYSTIAKAWKADFNQENSDKLLATVKKYWPDDYEHAVKQMEGIGTKTAAEHKKESISVDFSQIENTSEKLAENIKFINEKYPEYKGNLTHILTDIMFNATSKNRNEILDKFRDCNNKDELNSKLKKMVYGSFETEIKKQQNVKPKKDPEEGFSR